MGTKPTRKRTASGKKDWRKRFIAALSHVPNVKAACRTARVDRTTVYEERRANPAFAEAWEVAVQEGLEVLEEAMWTRAVDGVKRGVWRNDSDGDPVKVEDIREYSDTLAIVLAKAHAPAKYRDNVRTEISGPGGRPIEIAAVKPPIDFAEVDRIERELVRIPETNGNGESIHPAHSNGKAGGGPSSNGH